MTRNQVVAIHGFFGAANVIPSVVSFGLMCMLLLSGAPFGEAAAFCAAVLMVAVLWSAVATDMLARRIPNALPLQAMLASVLLWIGMTAGAGSVDWTAGILNPILTGWSDAPKASAYFPYAEVGLLAHLGISFVTAVAVFCLYFFAFHKVFGMGGGDVKLMTGAALFFGWPMTGDFVLLTVIAGGVWSAICLLSKWTLGRGITFGLPSEVVEKYSLKKEVPYAPAIAMAGTLCVIGMFGGVVS